MLSTALMLFGIAAFVVLAGVAMLRAERAAMRATDAEEVLARELRGVKQTRIDIAALEGKLERLAGRVYAQNRKPRQPEPEGDGDEVDDQRGLAALDPEIAATLALQTSPPVRPA